MRSTSSKLAYGCFVTILLILAVLFSIALLPAIYDIFTSYTFSLVWATVATCSLPFAFLAALVISWKSVSPGIVGENPPGLSAVDRILIIWLTSIAIIFFIWLTLQSLSFLVGNPVTIWWSLLATVGMLLVALFGYVLGSVHMEHNRKVAIYLGMALCLIFSTGFIVYLWFERDYSLKFWAGLIFGLIFSFLGVWYLQKRWDPVNLAPKNQTPTEKWLDVAVIVNRPVRG